MNDTSEHILATCPVGYTLILKDIRWLNANPAAQNLAVRVFRSGVQYLYLVYGSQQSGAPGFWSGWVILEPGDQLGSSTNAGPFPIWASGTVLAGEAPPT